MREQLSQAGGKEMIFLMSLVGVTWVSLVATVVWAHMTHKPEVEE